MKNFSLLFLITILLLSCNDSEKPSQSHNGKLKIEKPSTNEKFKTLTIDEVYKNITGTPKEIMQRYYPFKIGVNSEGNQILDISTSEIDAAHREVILIHDNMLDDSQKGIKIIMNMKKNGTAWKVTSIKKNWKCRKGRGHVDWGIERCS